MKKPVNIPFPKIYTEKSDMIRTIRSYDERSNIEKAILDCFEESTVIYSNAILNHLQPNFPRSTIYDNLKFMLRDEILRKMKDGGKNVYGLTLKGTEIIRTKQSGTTFHSRLRLECLRFSFRLHGPELALERLQSGIGNHRLGHCHTNDKLNWLQQIVSAKFSDLIGITLQFHWGDEPKVFLNLPAIWGENLTVIINRFFTRLEFVSSRIAAELFYWGVRIDDPVQVQDFELEFPFYNDPVEPTARMKLVERDDFNEVTKKFNTVRKKNWMDYSKKYREAGISLGNLNDLERCSVLLKSPEIIADMKLKLDSLEDENKQLKEQLGEITSLLQTLVHQQGLQSNLSDTKKIMI